MGGREGWVGGRDGWEGGRMGRREGWVGGREGGIGGREGWVGGWMDGERKGGRVREERGRKAGGERMLSTAGNVLPPKKPHLKTYYVLQKSSSCYYCAHG